MQRAYRDLQTERLLLRGPREGDARLVFEAYGRDPEVVRFLTWPPHRSIADAEAALAARVDRLARGVEYSWMLESSVGGRLVGLISIWPTDESAEVGFVLARPFWNRGLMTEAVIAVSQWALASPGTTHVWATCDAENHASARVLEKSGFTCEGPFERAILRPNISPEPRPSLLFSTRGSAAPEAGSNGGEAPGRIGSP